MKFIIHFVITVSFLGSFPSFANDGGTKIIKIGTGNKNALAYPVLSSMCEVFNQKNLDKNVSCQAISTGGSEDNLNGIIKGEYDAGVIKADMEYNAYNGIGVYHGKAYRELRTVFGLHNEYLTIIVKNNSNINDIQDIKGKSVYIGNKGSGSRILVDKLLAGIGVKNHDLKEVHEEQADKIHDLFCENKIDAAVYLVGHPNGIFAKTMKECDVKLIGFSKKEIERYVDLFRYVSPALIKKGTYPNQKEDIRTFASQLLLATSEKADEKTIYNFVQIIAENYEDLQKKNPALVGAALFSPEVKIIPMHNGVVRYHKNF